jgi:hypothetical protein
VSTIESPTIASTEGVVGETSVGESASLASTKGGGMDATSPRYFVAGIARTRLPRVIAATGKAEHRSDDRDPESLDPMMMHVQVLPPCL